MANLERRLEKSFVQTDADFLKTYLDPSHEV